jgi:hypothetical protein
MEEPEKRIAELADALKAAERKLAEMKTERDEATALVDRADEVADDTNAVIESWKFAFEMELRDDGLWTSPVSKVHDRYLESIELYNKLIKDWNRFVPKYNAAILQRPVGRLLDASEAQQKQVLKSRSRGISFRGIADDMNLSLRTVRTIIERGQGRDRTTLKRLEKVEPMNAAVIAARARKRTRDTLPKRIKAVQDEANAIKKAAKGLGK